jgi:regulatory protein
MNAEALERAIRFIEYRPRSCGETRDRLRRWDYTVAESDEVVAHLEACGLLDDGEFARMFVSEMIRKGFGYQRVRAELFKKRLGREAVDHALEGYPSADELDRALDLAERLALRLGDCSTPTNRRKMMGYLTRKGYSRSIAAEACSRAGDVDTNLGPE